MTLNAQLLSKALHDGVTAEFTAQHSKLGKRLC
jgi:hypothetical protein